MDYGKYKNALEKAKVRYNEIKGTNCSEEKFLLELFPELKKSEDERIRKALVGFHKSTIDVDGIKGEEIVAWLEKQGEQKPIMNVPSREVILSIWDLGNEWKELTSGDISTEYGTQLDYIQKHWHESEYYLRAKQDEKKVTTIVLNAKDWYVSNVDGKIHDVTYNAADNVEKKGETKNEQEALNNWYVEYVYILDYSTGRVIVAKHDVEESISELFEQLGLKESQCHYMTSSNILSIEYINF